MDIRPNKNASTNTQTEAKQPEPRQESNELAKDSAKRPFSKPVLKKFRQIDYVATYGSK
jgi:hypothetical protein